MSNFPTLNGKEDSQKFGFEVENVGMRSEMEGGYVLTRPRHTRAPRRTWTTGFTNISQTDYETFLSFWNTNGTYNAFSYVVPTTDEIVNVRFADVPAFKYSGHGRTFRWDIDNIKLEEV